MSGRLSTAFSNASAASVATATSASGESACCNIPSTIGLSSTSRILTLLAITLNQGQLLLLRASSVVAALAAGFFLQNYFPDFDALVERLAHVVHSQSGHAGRNERFHLHASLCCGLYFCGNSHAIFAHA